MYLNFFTLFVIDFPAIAVSCYCLQRVRNNYHKTAGSKNWEAISWKENQPTFVWRWTLHYDDLEMWETLFENPIEATILHFIKELPNCWSWSIEIAKFSHNRRQNCWDSTSENKTISVYPSPLPSIQSWGVCCFSQVARTAAYHRLQGVGEGKFHLTFLKVVNCCKGSLSKSV